MRFRDGHRTEQVCFCKRFRTDQKKEIDKDVYTCKLQFVSRVHPYFQSKDLCKLYSKEYFQSRKIDRMKLKSIGDL